MVAKRRLIRPFPPPASTPETSSLSTETGLEVAAPQQSDQVERGRRGGTSPAADATLAAQRTTILELSFEQDMSQSEIAAATKLPLGTVKTHARRGLIRLRQLLVQIRPITPGGIRMNSTNTHLSGPESSFLAAILSRSARGIASAAALAFLEKAPAAGAGSAPIRLSPGSSGWSLVWKN